MKEKPVVKLQFSVVPSEEAMTWISDRTFGRFAELKQNLADQLRTLRRKESLTIPAVEDEKENLAMISALKAAIKRHDLPWVLRHSKSKNCIVAVHRDVFLSKRKEGDN